MSRLNKNQFLSMDSMELSWLQVTRRGLRATHSRYLLAVRAVDRSAVLTKPCLVVSIFLLSYFQASSALADSSFFYVIHHVSGWISLMSWDLLPFLWWSHAALCHTQQCQQSSKEMLLKVNQFQNWDGDRRRIWAHHWRQQFSFLLRPFSECRIAWG